jgi:hypothetical protein
MELILGNVELIRVMNRDRIEVKTTAVRSEQLTQDRELPMYILYKLLPVFAPSRPSSQSTITADVIAYRKQFKPDGARDAD